MRIRCFVHAIRLLSVLVVAAGTLLSFTGAAALSIASGSTTATYLVVQDAGNAAASPDVSTQDFGDPGLTPPPTPGL